VKNLRTGVAWMNLEAVTWVAVLDLNDLATASRHMSVCCFTISLLLKYWKVPSWFQVWRIVLQWSFMSCGLPVLSCGVLRCRAVFRHTAVSRFQKQIYTDAAKLTLEQTKQRVTSRHRLVADVIAVAVSLSTATKQSKSRYIKPQLRHRERLSADYLRGVNMHCQLYSFTSLYVYLPTLTIRPTRAPTCSIPSQRARQVYIMCTPSAGRPGKQIACDWVYGVGEIDHLSNHWSGVHRYCQRQRCQCFGLVSEYNSEYIKTKKQTRSNV